MNHGQGFIQKFLFGVEGGVALSRTVAPMRYYIMCSYKFNYLILGKCYLRISKYPNILCPPPPPPSFFLSLSLLQVLFPSKSFSFGEASPPTPQTIAS